ncbi:MAG: glycoside hydrolase family 65 protein [Anaerolineae bacterium]|nr:glycoside hydrolase family 65 protein [Anaerolineae bacterium]
MHDRLWEIVELDFSPDELLHYETLFTIGNGYLGTRGAFEEGYPGDTPVTLVHGVYDHTPGMLVPELVNVPNWLPINIYIDGAPFKLITKTTDFMRPPDGVVLGYRRALNMRRGVLTREVLFRAPSGNIVRLEFERFASLHDIHVLAQRVRITAVDGNAHIRVESAIDADVTNAGVPHYLPEFTLDDRGDTIGVELKTQQSKYIVGVASRLVSPHRIQTGSTEKRPYTVTSFDLAQEDWVVLDKFSSIYTSRDALSPLETAQGKIAEAASVGYEELRARHEAEWAKYWETSDIHIDGDEEAQRALRFTTYHILIPAPRLDERVSIGAKTLSGLGYKGHVFWDTELFCVPPLLLTQPKLARNLLMYRYHNLPGARHKAQANGYDGAMYPWESTDTGEETTPQWSDPQPDGTKIRIWTGDSEQHISTDIAYAIEKYWRWTGDDEFLTQYGAEMILDTAVFWGSRVEEKNGRFEISQQIGPDEYHENIDNSVFVNRMVVWHLQTAFAVLDWLKAHAPADHQRLVEALKLTPERLALWLDITQRMYLPFDTNEGIHVQFPGFFDMEYIPVPHYTPRIGSVQAMLGHARTIQTQVIKQADVVMLMALLGEHIGVPEGFSVREVMLNNWNTYYPRCDHGSSLSPAMHAWTAARLGLIETAYELFDHAVHIDLHDNKGNVRDGIHAAACGGVWQAIVFGFCGLHIDAAGQPAVDPRLPEHWRSVTFTVYYRGEKQTFTVKNPALVSSSLR